MNPKELTLRREWLVWALSLSRAQRRIRGIRAQKLDLIGELQAVEHVLRALDTSTPGANDPVELLTGGPGSEPRPARSICVIRSDP